MKIRIGNDFKTKWAITFLGEPEDFSDATDISLSFNIYDKKIELTKDVDYTITDNIIEIDCTPDICNILGVYNLELHYTKPNDDFIDGERRSAVDIDAFRIVGKSDKADTTQDVSIISDAVAIFLDIAYKKLEEIEANEDVRITNEEERVTNENIRISNEQDRQTNTATAIGNAEQATLNANNSAVYANEQGAYANEQGAYANEQGAYAEEMSSHPPTIINDYWHIWNLTTNQYESTGEYARGDSAIDGALVVQTTGQSAVNTMSQKAVTDELVQLAGEVSIKADLHKVVSGNLYDKTKVVDGYYISTTTGVLASHETSKVSPLIPVTPDTIYFLSRTYAGTYEVRFLESDMITPIKPIDVLTGLPYTNYSIGSTNKAIKSPSNAAYFQFIVVFNGTGDPDTAQFKEGVSYSAYEEYTERQEVSPINLPVLPPMIIEKGKNLFDKTKVVSGYYLTNSGIVRGHSTSKISGLIDIIPGKTYYLTRTTTGANHVRFVKADGAPLKPLNPISGDEFGYETSASIAVKAPPLAKYFQFTVVFDGTGNPDTAQFEEGSIGTVYEEYTERRVLPLDNTAKEITELLQIANAEINPLKGKSVTFNGDSIGGGAPGAEGAYGAIIAGRNSMVYENKSVGGATITAEQYSAGNPRHWISRTISEMNENADYIILEGGVNDASLAVPFGTISSGYTDTLDDTTFCGAFESMLKQSVLRWKGKKIGFVIVHRIGTGAWTTTYQTAIWEMCKKWGIPVCDLFNNIPSLERISELKTIYTYNSDGWHPNALGYQKYYCDKIEAWMKTL